MNIDRGSEANVAHPQRVACRTRERHLAVPYRGRLLISRLLQLIILVTVTSPPVTTELGGQEAHGRTDAA